MYDRKYNQNDFLFPQLIDRYWNEFYGRFDTYDFGFGQEAFQEKGCAFTNCFTTKDRNLLPVEEYDAIIIHIRGLPNDWPKSRSSHQVRYC